MLSNPLKRVIFRNKALDGFRFTIRPENIDLPASTGIFPRHESWSLLGHPPNMRLWRLGSSQLSCHNQTDPLPWLGFVPFGTGIGTKRSAGPKLCALFIHGLSYFRPPYLLENSPTPSMPEQISAASRTSDGDNPSSLWVNFASTTAAIAAAPATSRKSRIFPIAGGYAKPQGLRNHPLLSLCLTQRAGPKPAPWSSPPQPSATCPQPLGVALPEPAARIR
jgi:hypothetical protein